MLVNTKYFGQVDISDEKIITFEHGIMGFESCKKFTLLYDVEAKEGSSIIWLQSMEEELLALPVINPFLVKEDYNPIINEYWLKVVGDCEEDNLAMLLTMTVPKDLKGMTVNLKAPIIFSSKTKKGAQVIVENNDYLVKYPIYDLLNQKKGEA